MTSQENDGARWTLDLFGTFGKDAAGRRYRFRAGIALAVLVAGVFIAGPRGKEAAVWHWTSALLPGVCFSFIAYELSRYVRSLDELGRKLQMEAMSAAMTLGGIALAEQWTVNPIYFFISLEAVRGGALLVLSRRY
jgi:ABC-type sulfate transport system permease component